MYRATMVKTQPAYTLLCCNGSFWCAPIVYPDPTSHKEKGLVTIERFLAVVLSDW